MKKVIAIMALCVMGFVPFASARTVGVVYGDALVIGDIEAPVASIGTSGALSVASLSATGALSMAGVTNTGAVSETPNTASYSSIGISTSITPTGKAFIVLNASGTLTSTATPFISTTSAVSGQVLTLMGGANAVTLQDNGTLSGSLLELGSTTRALGAGDIIRLRYYDGKWWEESFANN